MKSKQMLTLILVFTLAAFSVAVHAQQNLGTAEDIIVKSPAFPEDLELLSYELGAENNINIGSISTGGGAGKAKFRELTITKSPDSATTILLKNLMTGSHMDTLILEDKNMEWEFRLVLVQDYSASKTTGDDVVEETWTLQFGAMKVKVAPAEDPGKPGSEPPEEFCWSQISNDPC